jgi:hypothetical protein
MKSNAKVVIERLKKALEQTIKDAPLVLGNVGQKSIISNFTKQSFEGKKWDNVKNKNKKNPILVGRTRKLINSARISFKSNNTQSGILKWSIDGVAYAKIHNEGGVINKKSRVATQNFRIKRDGSYRYAKFKKANFQREVNIKSHKINMPKRTFMKNTIAFRTMLVDHYKKMFKFNVRKLKK